MFFGNLWLETATVIFIFDGTFRSHLKKYASRAIFPSIEVIRVKQTISNVSFESRKFDATATIQ